jgi:phosphoglycerate dehydrogenase-like enzyme
VLKDTIAVCSRSFSKNKILRAELLSKYANVKFNDAGLELHGDALISFLQGQEKAIVALEKIDHYVLSALPNLKVISKYGVGLDMIDMDAMRTFKIRLGWEGGVNRRSVSELVIAFAITLLRQLNICNKEVVSGVFRQRV